MIRILIEEDCKACSGGLVPAGSDPLIGLLYAKHVPCSKCQGEKVIRRSLSLTELARLFDIETTYRRDNRPPEMKLRAK